MDSLFDGARHKVNGYLLRRPGESKRSSLWKIVIGCLGVIYAPISYLIEPSYTILAVFFLGLMLVAGEAANLTYAETVSGRRRTALLRAAALLCSILFVALVAVDIFATYVMS